MESFDSLLSKSVKTGKEFRFYAGAVLILSAAVSFLVFLACDKTFEELLQRENGMISIMYLILAGIFAAVFLYLMCLYRNFLSVNIRNSGILIAMGMPRKKLKKHLLIRAAIPVVTAVVVGTVFGYGIYDIVILYGVIHTGKTILQDLSISLLLSAILILISICYAGIIWNHRIFNYKDILDIVNGREAKMKRNGRPKVMAAVGLVFLVVGNLFLIINKIGTKEPSNLLVLISTVTVICGVYISVFSFGYWFPTVVFYRDKRRKSLLLINEIRSHYRNDAKALSAYAIINWINVFLIIVIVMLWLDNKMLDYSDSPYDYVLEFEEQGYDDMKEFVNRNEDAVYESHVLKSIVGTTVYGETEVVLIPEAVYNEMTGKALEIEKGHMIVLSQLDRSMVNITTEPDGREWHFWEIDYEIPMDICGYQTSFVTDYEIWEYFINCEDSQQRILILNDDDFGMAAQHGSLQYKLCVNLAEGKSIDISSLDEKMQSVHILGRQEHFIKVQKENNILIISLIAMLAVLNIILLFTQVTQYCSGKNSRKRDSYIQLTLGIKEGDKEKTRQQSLQIKNFLPVLIGGLTGCLCTICFIKDMNIYLATLSVAVFGAEIAMQMGVYVVERGGRTETDCDM